MRCPALVICNKADMANQWKEWTFDEESWILSASTGQGLQDLAAAIVVQLVPEPPPPGAAVPFTEQVCRQIDALADRLASLLAVQ
jgi:tRNA modification GTPase